MRVAADLVSEARQAKRLPDIESPMCRYSSAVVEQLICNQQVPSSTLGGGTIFPSDYIRCDPIRSTYSPKTL